MATPDGKKNRQASYTVEFKIKVISWYKENGENKHETSRRFGIDRKRVREWVDKEDQLRGSRVGAEKKKRKVNGGKPPLSAELDKQVLDFLIEERVAGRPVMNRDLTRKALQVATELALPDTFKASPMWLKRWKKRNQVSLRCGTNDAQKVPEDYHAQIWNFRAQIIRSHLRHDLAKFEVVNMDQTMCRFDMVPTRTNDIRGTRRIRITHTRANKKGFTVALAAKGNGEKLPALVIFKVAHCVCVCVCVCVPMC